MKDACLLDHLQLLEDLKEKMQSYFQLAERVSRSYVELALS